MTRNEYALLIAAGISLVVVGLCYVVYCGWAIVRKGR